MGTAVQAGQGDTDWTERCPASATTNEQNCPFPEAKAFDHNNNEIGVHTTIERVTAANQTPVEVKSDDIDWKEPAIYLFKYQATDSVGNSAEHIVFELVLDDLVKPAITCNSDDLNIEVDTKSGDDFPACTATDNIDSNPVVTYTIIGCEDAETSPAAGSYCHNKKTLKTDVTHAKVQEFFDNSFDKVSTYTVVAKAVDNAGMFGAHGESNTATQEVAVNVRDTTKPTVDLVGPSKVYLECGTSAEKTVVNGQFVDPTTKGAFTNVAGNWYNRQVKDGNDYLAEFHDPGVNVNDSYDTSLDHATANACKGSVSNPNKCLDPYESGDYSILYEATDSSGNIGEATRTVVVVDTEAPHVELIGPDTLEYHEKTDLVFNDPGVEVTDNCDNHQNTYQVSEKVKETQITTYYTKDGEKVSDTWQGLTGEGTYVKHYTVSDRAGNKNTGVKRTIIIVDREKPILRIANEGKQHETVSASHTAEYNDEGATCMDYVHGNLNRAVRSTGDIVKLSEPGNYYVTYTCKDPSGNHAVPLTKTITVADITCPTVTVTGALTQAIEAGFPYQDAGYTCNDDFSDSCTLETVGNTVNYANVFDAAENCKDVKSRYADAASGYYTLKLGDTKTVAYCDMKYLRTYFASEDLADTCAANGLVECSTVANCWSNKGAEDRALNELTTYFLDGSAQTLCSFQNEKDNAEYDSTESTSEEMVNKANVFPRNSGNYVITYYAKDAAGNTAACRDASGNAIAGDCNCPPTRTVVVEDTLPPVISLKLGDKLVAVSGGTNAANPAYRETTTKSQDSNPFLSLMAESTTSVNGWAVAAVASFVTGVALLSYTSKSSTASIPV
jgi:hypothetical protein